jgi:signal transduction histidine kinase
VTVETAQQIAEQARQALEQVRQLSRGIVPIDIDGENFMPALRQLASASEAVHKIPVDLNGDIRDLEDARTATQLYRIAQEAVTNVVKHARARRITIDLHAGPGAATMRIADDGRGMTDGMAEPDGLGLHIMLYRAGSIGADFSVSRGANGGTVVACTVRRPRHLAADVHPSARRRPRARV